MIMIGATMKTSALTRRSFVTLSAAVPLVVAACSKGQDEDADAPAASSATATQTLVVEGFDWGPNATKTVLDLGVEVDAASIDPASFVVSDRRQDYVDYEPYVDVVEHDRSVIDAYASDAQGNRVEGPSPYLTLEMSVGPDDGNVQIWDDDRSMNAWSDPLELHVTLTDGATISLSDGSELSSLEVSTDDLVESQIDPLMDVYTNGSFEASDGRMLTYAAFAPEADGQTHPLVIWLHGAGGGGTDIRFALFDTKMGAMVGDEFQATMGGAHVLVPQCDGFWMQWADENGEVVTGGNPGTASVWKAAVLELVDQYVSDHDDVDPDRIIVGGCSNGGFLTLDLVFERPDFFAAAYPISEAYLDAGITDEQLASVKDLPLWFVWSKADSVVDPTSYTEPTVGRLQALEARDLHCSVYDDATILAGEFAGYTFEEGHEAWIYFFNNECEDAGTSLWEWMAVAHR